MPKAKKPQRNAFYWYMQDLMPVLREEGRAFRGIMDVVPIALPRWKVLVAHHYQLPGHASCFIHCRIPDRIKMKKKVFVSLSNRTV